MTAKSIILLNLRYIITTVKATVQKTRYNETQHDGLHYDNAMLSVTFLLLF
jgi:hypothetical protein